MQYRPKESQLTGVMWYKDTPGHQDKRTTDNKGFTSRKALTTQSKSVQIMGNKGNNKITELRTIISLDKINSIFDIHVTEYDTALTTILPILFLYLNTVIVTAGTFEP
jgi:hypothetical protein